MSKKGFMYAKSLKEALNVSNEMQTFKNPEEERQKSIKKESLKNYNRYDSGKYHKPYEKFSGAEPFIDSIKNIMRKIYLYND